MSESDSDTEKFTDTEEDEEKSFTWSEEEAADPDFLYDDECSVSSTEDEEPECEACL